MLKSVLICSNEQMEPGNWGVAVGIWLLPCPEDELQLNAVRLDDDLVQRFLERRRVNYIKSDLI